VAWTAVLAWAQFLFCSVFSKIGICNSCMVVACVQQLQPGIGLSEEMPARCFSRVVGHCLNLVLVSIKSPQCLRAREHA